MEVVVGFFDPLLTPLIDFFNYIYEFFTVTVVEYLMKFVDWLIVKLTVFYIDAKIMSIKTAWGLAESVLDAINITPLVSQYVNRLSPNLGFTASAIGLIDALNIVLQAGVSSWILRVVRII